LENRVEVMDVELREKDAALSSSDTKNQESVALGG
jgi:hypothetical protein